MEAKDGGRQVFFGAFSFLCSSAFFCFPFSFFSLLLLLRFKLLVLANRFD